VKLKGEGKLEKKNSTFGKQRRPLWLKGKRAAGPSASRKKAQYPKKTERKRITLERGEKVFPIDIIQPT